MILAPAMSKVPWIGRTPTVWSASSGTSNPERDVRRAAGVELVAVRTVGLEVRPRPAIEIGRLVVGIDQCSAASLGSGVQARSPSLDARHASWLTGSPPVSRVRVHLGRVHAQRRGRLDAEDRRLLLDPGIVAQDALGPGVNPVVVRSRWPPGSRQASIVAWSSRAASARAASVWSSFQT